MPDDLKVSNGEKKVEITSSLAVALIKYHTDMSNELVQNSKKHLDAAQQLAEALQKTDG
jgi:hypothetical protein